MNNRHHLKLAEAKAGDEVELDGGFACCKSGVTKLYLAPDGLFFYCDNGRHYLNGTSDDGIHCIGIYPVAKQPGQRAANPTLSGSVHTHLGLAVDAEPSRASHYS